MLYPSSSNLIVALSKGQRFVDSLRYENDDSRQLLISTPWEDYVRRSHPADQYRCAGSRKDKVSYPANSSSHQ